jgi:hypothetical protein
MSQFTSFWRFEPIYLLRSKMLLLCAPLLQYLTTIDLLYYSCVRLYTRPSVMWTMQTEAGCITSPSSTTPSCCCCIVCQNGLVDQALCSAILC